jgi:hypothetical protein
MNLGALKMESKFAERWNLCNELTGIQPKESNHNDATT